MSDISICKWAVRGWNGGKTKPCSQNDYQMAIVQTGISFICKTNGGTLFLKDLLHSHDWNMWDIFI